VRQDTNNWCTAAICWCHGPVSASPWMSTDDLLMWLRRGPPMTPSSCRPLQADTPHEITPSSCLRLSALVGVVLTTCQSAVLQAASGSRWRPLETDRRQGTHKVQPKITAWPRRQYCFITLAAMLQVV
jgi:hypothetical protein